jgi:hypothetical protein
VFLFEPVGLEQYSNHPGFLDSNHYYISLTILVIRIYFVKIYLIRCIMLLKCIFYSG